MKTLSLPGVIAAMCLILPCSLASTAEVAMTRVLFCENDDAKMEVYVPQANISGGGVANANLAEPVIGYYALDLTEAGKGKPLEPVRVSLTADTLIVDQFTRQLPPTRIPVAGGTVDFDKRFGEKAKCRAFNSD
jgi:hypothetical protein